MRKINELIWHCTATPEGREISVAEIDRWHRARGWSGIGYHKVVHLNGRVSQGRPEARIGAHVAGHNRGTIGYVYVGGVARNGRTPKDTRTPAQKRAMLRLSRAAIRKYGLKKISGHNQYAAKACPSFDVRRDPLGRLVPPNRDARVDTYSAATYASFERDIGMPGKDPARLGQSNTVRAALAGTGGGGAFTADAGQNLAYQLTDANYQLSAGTVIGFVIGSIIVSTSLWALYDAWNQAGRPVPPFWPFKRKAAS